MLRHTLKSKALRRLGRRTLKYSFAARPSRKHRLTSVFFVSLMVFVSGSTLFGFLLQQRAQKKAIQATEVLRSANPETPIAVNPDYKDPRVKPQKEVKPLKTASQVDAAPKIDGVSEAARQTAILWKSYEAYFSFRSGQGSTDIRRSVAADSRSKCNFHWFAL